MNKVKEILQSKEKAQELCEALQLLANTELARCSCVSEERSNVEWAIEVIEELAKTLWE